jgi:hypothetical protein
MVYKPTGPVEPNVCVSEMIHMQLLGVSHLLMKKNLIISVGNELVNHAYFGGQPVYV